MEPALGPEPVETTLDLERAFAPDVALIDLAVVADRLEQPAGPAGWDTQGLGAMLTVLVGHPQPGADPAGYDGV